MRRGVTRPSGKVLVLGRDTRGFLSVIRSLGRRGLEVHVAWCDPRSPALRSRYVRAVHWVPAPSPDDLTWRDRFRDLLGREGFDLVVPCNDPSIIPLQLHRAALAPFASSIYLLDDAVFRVVFDKHASHELAHALGVPVAPRRRVARLEELAAIRSTLTFPALVKPRASFTPDRLERKHHVLWVHDAADLERQVLALLPWGEVGVEESVPGHGVGVEVLARDGRLLLAFQHERLHEPPDGGGSSYRRSTALHPGLLEATARFLEALRYTGVAMVEFRLDPRSGRWVFIEINARFWGSLPLALAAGADFPYHLYQLWVEGIEDFPQGYRTGVFGRNLVNDLRWLKQAWRAPRRDPVGPRISRWRLPGEVVRLLSGRDHLDTLVRDDPRPGLAELRQLVRATVPGARPALMRALLARPRWWRHRGVRARRALGEARRVLFVCKGNVCRSPFAHRLAEQVWPAHLRIDSCGYHPEPGRRCPPEAVQIAGELGVDLGSHRSRVLSPERLDAADAVFVFDEENYLMLRARYGWAMPKVHVLGVLGTRPTAIIRDPSGGTLDDFRRVYGAIRESVLAGDRALRGPGAPRSAGSVAAA